jgi:phage tail-like protein
MTRPLASDPLRNFRFQVAVNHPTIQSFPRMGFMGVTGLAVATEAIPYREGGNNTTTRKMPGQTDFGPVGLTRGCMAAPTGAGRAGTSEAWQWFQQIFAVMDGNGTGTLGADFRCPITIDVLEHPITSGPGSSAPTSQPAIKVRYQLYNAWPMGISWSDLDAGGNAIVIESLQLAHEGFDTFYADNNPTSVLGTGTGLANNPVNA